MQLEHVCIVVVLAILLWYYFEVYSKGKSLEDLWKKKQTCTVQAQTEEFENNISSHINRFDTAKLKGELYI